MWHTINVIFFPLIRNFTLSTSHFHFFPSHSEHRLSSLRLSLCLTSLKPCLAQPSHRQHPSRSHSNILRPPLVRVQVLLSSSPLVRVQVLVSLSLSVFSLAPLSLSVFSSHINHKITQIKPINQTHPKLFRLPSKPTHTQTKSTKPRATTTTASHRYKQNPQNPLTHSVDRLVCFRSVSLLQIGSDLLRCYFPQRVCFRFLDQLCDLLRRLWRKVLREKVIPAGEERENIIKNGQIFGLWLNSNSLIWSNYCRNLVCG